MRKNRGLFLASALLLAVSSGTIGQGMSVFAAKESAVKQMEERKGETHGGVISFGNGNASITIKGKEGQSLVGKNFYVYQLFFAENAKGGESINYTFHPKYEEAVKTVVAKGLTESGKPTTAENVTEYMAVDYIQSLNSYKVEGATTPQELEGSYSQFRYFVETLRDELETRKIVGDEVSVTNTQADNSIRIEGLEYGYYLVDEVTRVQGTHAAGSLCMVSTANPATEIQVKSDYPTVIKKIDEDDQNEHIKDPDGWNDIGDYEIGQTVPFKYESNIPNMNGYKTYYYAWHDQMDQALTFQKESVKVEITNDEGKKYTLKDGEFEIQMPSTQGETFAVIVTDIKQIVDREFPNFNEKNENVYGQKVLLRYDAVLNDKAANDTGRPGFENDVRLEFSNNPDSNGGGSTGYTPWDTVVCFTYRLDLVKVNDHDQTLAGAKFRLYSDENCENEVYVKDEQNGYHVINRDVLGGTDHTGGTKPKEAVEMITDSRGELSIIGLDQGTYYLKETKAPDGYRLLKDPIVLKVMPTYTDKRDEYVKGQGATNETLQKLEVTAHIKSFYDGSELEEDQQLETDAENGNANLTVVNRVGSKLPVTGTPAMAALLLTGCGCMLISIVLVKKKGTKKK